MENGDGDKQSAKCEYLIASMCLALCLASWEAMGLTVHNLEIDFPQPFFITYCVRAGWGLFGLVIWVAIRFSRDQPLWQPELKGQLLFMALAVVTYIGVIIWIQSMKMTIVSLNNAVYQTTPSFVYIFSVLFLKLKVTVRQVLALAVCLAGVILITFFGAHTANKIEEDVCQVCGYLLCVASVVVYALYEVMFKKFEYMLKPPGMLKPLDDETEVHKWKPVPFQDSQDSDREEFDIADEAAPGGKTLCLNSTEEGSLFLGMIGLYTILLLWPALIIANYICWDDDAAAGDWEAIADPKCLESFTLPYERDANGNWTPRMCGDQYCIVLLMIYIVLELFFHMSLLIGIALTSPLFMSVGIMLIIPIGIAIDYILDPGLVISAGAFAGCGLIVVGFVLLELLTFLRCCRAEHHYHRFWTRVGEGCYKCCCGRGNPETIEGQA